MSDPDSFQWGDSSFAVPRPGAGRRGAAGEPPGQETVIARPPAGAQGPGTSAPPVPAIVGIGFTPLVQAATPLLVLIGQLRSVQHIPNIRTLREQCLQQIGRYEQRALASGVDPRVVQAARYVLCAGLDEAVLATLWGAQSEWMQNTLLMELHRERFGGENFFVMLDRFSKDPAQYGDMIELQYLCLALGFAGRYHGSEQNVARLRQIRGSTFNLVRDRRDAPPSELSPRWRGLEDRRNRLVRYVPWWVVAAGMLAVVAVTFWLLALWLRQQATPVQVTLAGLGKISSTRPSASLTLRQLLRPEEAAGVLSITENGNETTIIPEAVNLFASGKVEINPTYTGTLQRIAAALNRVPGRVLITGHTDDQPIRSSLFADNFELSRERAVSVARLLQADLSDPSRVTSQGMADTNPRARPPSQPENRARNRRVEIIHVP
jgi:type VI secretion system protein ImpK